MTAGAEWVPMRWPREWREPALLELVHGTPVNCLVVDGETAPAVAEGARAAGLKLLDPRKDRAELSWTERAKVPWSSDAAVVAITDATWPGVPARRGGGDGVEAGPTGMPWVDANGWLIQLARARARGKAVWMAMQPPEKPELLRAASYLLAIADAQAYGARWAIALDAKLRAGLAAKRPEALETWKSMTRALEFFQAHRDWNAFQPAAAIGVISDFSGANEDLSGEILNLLARRGAPYRVLEKRSAAAAPFAGLKAILYADQEPPDAVLAKKIAEFVTGGGLLVAGAKYPLPAKGAPAGTDAYRRYNLHPFGKGRFALAREEAQDPYLLAVDAQLLLSHRHAPLRFFNSGTLNSFYTAAADGRKALLQVVNYATRRSGNPVSVAFQQRYRTARLWRMDAGRPSPLEVHPVEMGIEIYLPQFEVYAAVELE